MCDEEEGGRSEESYRESRKNRFELAWHTFTTTFVSKWGLWEKKIKSFAP